MNYFWLNFGIDEGLLHEVNHSYECVDEWNENEFDDDASQKIESSDEEDGTDVELDMDDWGLYLTDDDEYDANKSASCFAEPSADSKEASKLKNSLAEWAVKSRIPRMHVNSLLRILKTDGDLQYLPLDARTLLKTTRGKLVFKSVPPGHYHHVGIEPVLISFLEGLESKRRRIPKEIRLFMNVDGIPFRFRLSLCFHSWSLPRLWETE